MAYVAEHLIIMPGLVYAAVINRYLQAYDENSLEGLIPKTPGPKGPTTPWKITPPIRDYIWELVVAEPELT